MLAEPAHLSAYQSMRALPLICVSADNLHVVRKSELHPTIHLHRHLFHHTHPEHRVKLINWHFSVAQVLYKRLQLTPP